MTRSKIGDVPIRLSSILRENRKEVEAVGESLGVLGIPKSVYDAALSPEGASSADPIMEMLKTAIAAMNPVEASMLNSTGFFARVHADAWQTLHASDANGVPSESDVASAIRVADSRRLIPLRALRERKKTSARKLEGG